MEGIATYTERTIYHKRCHCLVASSLHFTLSDLDFKWMSHKYGYWTAKPMYNTHSGTCNSNTDSIRNYIATSKLHLHEK